MGFPNLSMINAQNTKTFTTSDGETLYYTSTGKGQRVIMLPPGPGASVNVIKSWSDSLSKDFECILFEQRGTGLSSNVKLDSTTVNLKRAVKDIEDLRVRLGSSPIMICGISWGGALAQAYAASYPLNVKKIVLVSSLGPDRSLFPAYRDNANARKCQCEIDSLEYWEKQPDSEESRIQRGVFGLVSYFFD
jgi:proline iminopeptidase